MGTLKVIVRNDALNFMQEVTHWYECTMGRKAAQKFTDDIRNTISTLSRFPGIGTSNTIVAQQQQNITVFCLIPNIVLFIVLQKRPSI